MSRDFIIIDIVENEKGVTRMPKVIVRDNETFEETLRKFKRQVNKSGILTEAKRKENYLKPSLRRKEKAALARKKSY